MTALDTNLLDRVRNSESELEASKLATHYSTNRPELAHTVQQPMPGVSAIWTLFLRQYWVVVLGVVGGALLAGLYCVFAVPVYQANVKIWVSQKKSTKPVLGSDSGQEQEPPVGEDILATHMEFVTSPLVVKDALARGEIGRRESIVEAVDGDETPVEYVIDNLRVTKGGEGGGRSAHVLNLSFRHTSAEDCKAVLESLVDSYKCFLKDTFELDQEKVLRLAERRRDETQADLEVLRQERQNLRRAGFWGADSVDAHQDKVEQRWAELRKIEVDRIATAARLKTIRDAQSGRGGQRYTDLQLLGFVDQRHLERMKLLVEVPRGGADAQLRKSITAELQSQLEQNKLELARLLSKWGHDHPQVKRVKKTIDDIKESLRQKQLAPEDKVTPATVVASYVALLNSDLANLESQKREVKTLLEGERKNAAGLVNRESNDERLQNQIRIREEWLKMAEENVIELELEYAYAGFNTKVIAPAELGKQVAPKPALFIALGTILGMCLGTALAVARDNMGQTFCSDDDNYQNKDDGHLEASLDAFSAGELATDHQTHSASSARCVARQSQTI